MTIDIKKITTTPIRHTYQKPNASLIKEIKSEDDITIMMETPNIKIENTYYENGYAGTSPYVYTRKAISRRLIQVADLLAKHWNAGLLIFDMFRTIETQKSLFEEIYNDIQKKNPTWTTEQVEKETRCYVSHPTDPGHYPVPLHNSGGAVDLAIYDKTTGEMWDFGTGFDDMTQVSGTDFFEQEYSEAHGIDASHWETIQKNRRVLFHLMKAFDFVNYHYEWWHYDCGNCNWANVLKTDWIFRSMEHDMIHEHTDECCAH